MQWHELFPKDKPPSDDDINRFLGDRTARHETMLDYLKILAVKMGP